MVHIDYGYQKAIYLYLKGVNAFPIISLILKVSNKQVAEIRMNNSFTAAVSYVKMLKGFQFAIKN